MNGYHLTVTSEDPEKVIQEIKMLAESSDAQKIAATKNLQEIRKSLNPRIIKEDFENLIRDLGSGLRTGQRCAASFKISRT